MKKKEISARELFEKTYNSFKKKLSGTELKLPHKAMSKIANDSDGHRTRVGYTGYEMALIFTVKRKRWAMSFGTACGAYPAEPFNCDIAAIKISGVDKSDEMVAKEICEALEKTSYFSHSLVYAMADGRLATHNKKVSSLIARKIKKFTSAPLRIDSDFIIMSTLAPAMKSAVKYKPEFADFLFNTFLSMLAK